VPGSPAIPETLRHEQLNERLAHSGFRATRQREQVYQVLVKTLDHPTAEEVFIRAKKELPEISMATVYNCLEALVHCGLVRSVTLERGAARYCPNMRDHCHFYCDYCQTIFDVDLPPDAGILLPPGFRADRFDLTIHGRCRACANGHTVPRGAEAKAAH
jgi:Fur family transcriptional regulator, peroxide stress response regulator